MKAQQSESNRIHLGLACCISDKGTYIDGAVPNIHLFGMHFASYSANIPKSKDFSLRLHTVQEKQRHLWHACQTGTPCFDEGI
eukprot:scaffold119734_cov39-Prasinocladus_malaysianus.AAC.1